MNGKSRSRALIWMLVSATATTVGAVACSHGWDSYDPRLGSTSVSGSGGGTAQTVSASESASSTSVTASTSNGSSTSSGAGGGDGGPPTYRDIVLAEGPLAYWRLGESQGPKIIDELGQHPGTVSAKGLTYGVPGVIAGNGAMSFDGHSGTVSVASGWDFADKAPYTFELWIKLAPATNDYPRIISKEDITGPRDGYLLLGGAPIDGGSPFVGSERWVGGNDTLAVYYTGAVSSSTWTHVVSRFDGKDGAIFINGAVAQSYGTNSDAGLVPNMAPFTIGSEGSNGSHFAGSLDEIAIYGKALSDDVIANHYTAGAAGL